MHPRSGSNIRYAKPQRFVAESQYYCRGHLVKETIDDRMYRQVSEDLPDQPE
jgi:hypothetical protein